MDKEDRIDALEQAQEKIEEAIDLIRSAVSGTEEENGAEAYVIPSLTMCAYDKTQYLGQQPYNCDELINTFENEEEEEDVEID